MNDLGKLLASVDVAGIVKSPSPLTRSIVPPLSEMIPPVQLIVESVVIDPD